VDAALAAGLPLEVLDDVGDVRQLPVDARLLERLVEQPAGGPDERFARQVFLVAGLLADEDDLGLWRALAEDRLRRVFVEVAPGAGRGRFSERFQRRVLGLEELLRHGGCLPW